MKNIIKVKLESLLYELEGSFDSVIGTLQQRYLRYTEEGKYQAFILEADTCDRYEDYDGLRICVFGLREETDEEYNKRIKEEDSHKENRRLQYELLKKEFEAKDV